MYADLDLHNEAARLEMAWADRKAAKAWRYRHHKGASSRALSAAWAVLQGLLGKGIRIEKPDIAPARRRLSY